MKKQNIMKTVYALFTGIVATLFLVNSASAQVYANTQTNGAYGSCVGCGITNAANAVDVPLTNYETLTLTVSVPGVYVGQKLYFPSTASLTAYVGIVVEDVNLLSIGATQASGLSLTTYKDGISNNDTKTGAQVTISLVSDTRYSLEFQAGQVFDEVEVKFNAGIAGALSSIRVYYAYYKNSGPLPIGLLSFNAEVLNSKVNLKWATATEQNNDFFTIEKSTDGVSFNEIATVDGSGNSSSTLEYSTEDPAPVDGLNYYRLKQTDFNGDFNYFHIASVDYKRGMFYSSVYPNPSTGSFTVASTMDTDYHIVDAAGHLIRTFYTGADNNHSEQISGLDNGVYFVIGNSGSNTVKNKIVVAK